MADVVTHLVATVLRIPQLAGDPFALVNHPWQSAMLSLHVLASPPLILTWYWRQNPPRAGFDADKVKATFKNGVLEVHLPKTKESKAKTIEIKAA